MSGQAVAYVLIGVYAVMTFLFLVAEERDGR